MHIACRLHVGWLWHSDDQTHLAFRFYIIRFAGKQVTWALAAKLLLTSREQHTGIFDIFLSLQQHVLLDWSSMYYSTLVYIEVVIFSPFREAPHQTFVNLDTSLNRTCHRSWLWHMLRCFCASGYCMFLGFLSIPFLWTHLSYTLTELLQIWCGTQGWTDWSQWPLRVCLFLLRMKYFH